LPANQEELETARGKKKKTLRDGGKGRTTVKLAGGEEPIPFTSRQREYHLTTKGSIPAAREVARGELKRETTSGPLAPQHAEQEGLNLSAKEINKKERGGTLGYSSPMGKFNSS